MPRGQLFINGNDAYERYGISMDSSALSTLMTPNSKKDWISNEVRDEDGIRVLTGSYAPKNEARELSLTFNLVAPDEETFFARYNLFCNEVLESGIVNLQTSFQPDIMYRCIYESCGQFSQFRRQMAQFQLKIKEYNPNNRAI